MPLYTDLTLRNFATTMFSPAANFSRAMTVRAEHCYRAVDEQRDVFESHRHHIFSVAYYMTGDEREAETILQSTFLQAFDRQERPSIETLDQSMMGELRRRLSMQPVPAMIAEGQGLNGRNVRRTDLEEALWQMPARERLCFLLRDVEGYTPNRIAGLLATSEMEVQCTVLSARLRMRSLLNQLHGREDRWTEQHLSLDS